MSWGGGDLPYFHWTSPRSARSSPLGGDHIWSCSVLVCCGSCNCKVLRLCRQSLVITNEVSFSLGTGKNCRYWLLLHRKCIVLFCALISGRRAVHRWIPLLLRFPAVCGLTSDSNYSQNDIIFPNTSTQSPTASVYICSLDAPLNCLCCLPGLS